MKNRTTGHERDYPDLKSVLKSFEVELDAYGRQATSQILEILPKAELLQFIIMYETRGGTRIDDEGNINEQSRKSKNKSGRREKLYSPKRELKTITKELENLTWLTSNHREEIMDFIKIKLASTKKGMAFISTSFSKSGLYTGGRHKARPALDMLVVDLVTTIKQRTTKPHYQLIADFLHEQKIIKGTDALSLRKKMTRVRDNPMSLAEALDAYPNIILLKLHLLKLASGEEAEVPEWIQKVIAAAFQ